MRESLTGLEAELRSNGISVESLSRGAQVDLSYLTAFPGRHVHHMEVGRVCNTFIDLLEADAWEPKPVHATVLRSDDDVQGTWQADAEWFEALVSYRMSEEEFSRHVIDTLGEP
jgi:hypothetical protein